MVSVVRQKKILREGDEDSTEAGSVLSDAESTGSSAAASIGGKAKLPEVLSTAPKRGGRGGRRSRIVPRSLCLGAAGYFTGTPLEPIPGTPVNDPSSPWKHRANATDARRTCDGDRDFEATVPGFRPPPGLAPPVSCLSTRPQTASAMCVYEPRRSTTLGEPPRRAAMRPSASLPGLAYVSVPGAEAEASPKRNARNRMLLKAQEHALPLKVTLPELSGGYVNTLNPRLPVKKRSTFADSLGDFALINVQNLEPNMPAKKRVSPFLLTDPPHVFATPVQPR